MTGTRIFASTSCLASRFSTLPEMLGAYDRAGISAIEFGHCPPLAQFDPGRDLLQYRGRALIHNYFPPCPDEFVLNLAAQDHQTLSRSRAFCFEAMQHCASIGAPFYSVHCGFLGSFAAPSLGKQLSRSGLVPYATGYETFVDSLGELLREAAELGVRLALEPNVVCPCNLTAGRNDLLLLAQPSEFRRLFSDVTSQQLGVLLDLGHLKVTAESLRFSIKEFLDAVGPRICGFHLHDNDGLTDLHCPVTSEWMLELVADRVYQSCPIVVEAAFPNVAGLAGHIEWLKAALQ